MKAATLLCALAGCDLLFQIDRLPVPPGSDAPPAGGSVDEIVAGAAHTCARRGPKVRCWGRGATGAIGYADTESVGDDEPPRQVDVMVGADVVQISAGKHHTCAVTRTGNVRCWGLGAKGRLGYGNETTIGNTEPPSSAGDVPLEAEVTQVVAGDEHTCALRLTGEVLCWGSADEGHLGNATLMPDIGDTEPPSRDAVMLGMPAIELSTSHDHTCARSSEGRVRCWGDNGSGRLGYGHSNNIGDDEHPSVAGDVPLPVGAKQIAAGHHHTCAVSMDDRVLCWGRGDAGQLGTGAAVHVPDAANATVVSLPQPARQVVAGELHTCARLIDGSVYCWGSGIYGRLGYGNTESVGDNELPATVGAVKLGARAVHLAAGSEHTCALLASGGIRCWGLAIAGQLGYGNTNDVGDNEVPAELPELRVF